MTRHSQGDDFPKHAQAVANHADLAAFGVVPSHGNFAETKAGAMREKEKFDIEGETLDARGLQDWPAHIETKRFETALGIPKRKTGPESHEQIENAAGLFAAPRLMLPD